MGVAGSGSTEPELQDPGLGWRGGGGARGHPSRALRRFPTPLINYIPPYLGGVAHLRRSPRYQHPQVSSIRSWRSQLGARGMRRRRASPTVGPQSVKSRPKVGPESAQSRPKIGPKSAQDRPKIGAKSAKSQPRVGLNSRSRGQLFDIRLSGKNSGCNGWLRREKLVW